MACRLARRLGGEIEAITCLTENRTACHTSTELGSNQKSQRQSVVESVAQKQVAPQDTDLRDTLSLRMSRKALQGTLSGLSRHFLAKMARKPCPRRPQNAFSPFSRHSCEDEQNKALVTSNASPDPRNPLR